MGSWCAPRAIVCKHVVVLSLTKSHPSFTSISPYDITHKKSKLFDFAVVVQKGIIDVDGIDAAGLHGKEVIWKKYIGEPTWPNTEILRCAHVLSQCRSCSGCCPYRMLMGLMNDCSILG